MQIASLACALLLAFIGIGGPRRAEAQVLTVNLAAGKPATQSSTHEGAAAARAVDGKTDGNWAGGSVTHTESNAKAWWQVDLGAINEIGQVVIYNRTDCCTDRLANYDILVSNDGTAWTRTATWMGAAPARSAFSINASGRFVRVQLQGTNYLSLAEVQVFALQNLAAGKTASQSSTHEGAAAARAVDGNTNGAWLGGSVTHTESDAKAWWQVDLGAMANIGKVVLYNRTDCCAERLSNFVIQVSNDGTAWTQVGALAGTAPARSAFLFDAAARYVRVQLQGTNYLSLAEVQVFPLQNLAAGKPASQSSTHEGAAAARAVDGNTSGAWLDGSVTHTESNAKAWWQVDLGAVTLLGKVVLYNRTDCCADRLSNFVIQVSNDGTTWTQVGALAGTAPARSTSSFSAAGRYVRVQLQGTNFLSLAEAQVFPPQN